MCLYFEGVPRRVPNSRGAMSGGETLPDPSWFPPQVRPLCTVLSWPTTPRCRGAQEKGPALPRSDSAVLSCYCRWGRTAAARYTPPRDPQVPHDSLGSPHRPLSHLKVPVCWADLSSWPLGYLGGIEEGGKTPTTPVCPPKTPASPCRVPMGCTHLCSHALGSLGVSLGRLRRLEGGGTACGAAPEHCVAPRTPKAA